MRNCALPGFTRPVCCSLLFLAASLTVSEVAGQDNADPTRYKPSITIKKLKKLLPDGEQPDPLTGQPVPPGPSPIGKSGKGPRRRWNEPKGAENLQGKPRNQLTSFGTLNRYLANQTVRYLTGAGDVSYYDNYFTANSGDGSFTFGRTKAYKDSIERVKGVLNYGLKTKLLNDLGNVFSKRTFSREVGIYTNYTVFIPGSIWYDPAQAAIMEGERVYILQTLETALTQELTEFDQNQAEALTAFRDRTGAGDPGTDPNTKAFVNSQEKAWQEFGESLDKKYTDQFFELEEAAAKPRINFVRSNWWTFSGSTSGVTDKVAPDILTPPVDRLFIGVKGGVSFSIFAEDFRHKTDKSKAKSWYRLRSLVTFSAGIQNTNQLRLLDRYGADAAAQLQGQTAKGDATQWQGAYENWAILNLEGRALFTMPNLTNVVSLDIFASSTTGRYASQDAGIGFLFSLPDQTKKAPVNVEVLAKFVDLGGTLLPGRDLIDRLQIGLSVALPFNSNLSNL